MGVIAAQLVHAAGESSSGNLPPDTHAIVLSVPNEAKLLALERKLQEAGIQHNAIREPDLPWDGALMSIGIKPTYRHVVKKVISNLPLLR